MQRDYKEWFYRNQGELSHGGLWFRGGELNTLPPSEFEKRPLKALFVRLSSYLDTGYSFTHQILYQIAAETNGVFPDLAYLPPPKDAQIFGRDQIPWLIGTQTKLGPEHFDVLGFSNSIVQELINVPHFLRNSGIPLKKSERLARPDLPLVLLGGANALFSSCIWMDEAIVDGIFVGESDTALRQILEICRDGKISGLNKIEILERLEQVPGFFQPDRPRETKKNFALDLNKSEALREAPVFFIPEQVGSAHLQISEGCPCFCSFCAETWERRPYRERKAETLKAVALKLKAAMGLDSIDIYSFNFNLHSELYQVLWDLAPMFRNIGLKSQRFDLLAHDPEMLKFQQALNKTSLTCGLEGISPRLREYLNKNLTTEDLHISLEAIFKNKTREIKVFLIATGLEEEQDFEALSDLLGHMKQIMQTAGTSTRVVFSMTPLVRFPWTPLEFEDAPAMNIYDAIIRKAATRIRAAGFEFRESADLPEYWVSQVLVRADKPGISRALIKAGQDFVYYREITETFRARLEQCLKEEDLDIEQLFAGFDLEASKSKPWVKVHAGVKRDFLWKMFNKVREFREIDYCLGRSWTKAKCSACGGCPTKQHIRDIVLAKQEKPYRYEDFRQRRLASQKDETVVSLEVQVGEAGRGLPRKIVAAAFARALMLTDANLVEGYRGYAGSLWDLEEQPVWVFGAERLDLYFSQSSAQHLSRKLVDADFLKQINSHLGDWGSVKGMATKDWRPNKLTLETATAVSVDLYLKDNGLKHSLRKMDEGNYIYEFIPQAKKKGLILNLRRMKGQEPSKLTCWEFDIGPKFRWDRFEDEVLKRSRGFQISQSKIVVS